MGHYLKLAQQAQQRFTEVRQAIPVPPEPISTTAKKSDAVPAGLCITCGGGYCIRVTRIAEWQCGRCSPSESRVETVFVPDGTAPVEFREQPDTPRVPVLEPAVTPDGTQLSPVYWGVRDESLGQDSPNSSFKIALVRLD